MFSITVHAYDAYDAKCEALQHMNRAPQDRVNLQIGGKLEAREVK